MNTVVKTRSGEVRGSVAEGVYTFKGIPYAAPPFGPNRLRPPQPVSRWSGVRDALSYSSKAPQPPYPPQVALLIPPELAIPGEDCLTLNIWSPDLGAARLPVMVWIAGGMFEYHATGASPWYDGSRFARDGIVCVTITYRVGAEGFLSLGEGNANRGLLDQIAALQWVQENIAAFGGDPAHVTIFGESAGGMSVGTLLAMPRAEGLFRRAIMQSGSAHHVTSATTAQRISQYLAEKLGIAAIQEAIAAVPLNRLLVAQEELRVDLVSRPDPERWGEVAANLLPWEPVIDGELLPARPIDRMIAGANAGVEIMIGTNTEEWRLFLVPGGTIEQVTNEALVACVTAYGLPVEAALATYRAAYPDAHPGDLLAAIQGDWYWRIPTIRMAEAHAKHSSATYMYEFAWRSPQFNGLLGACHGLEIPFVFDTLGNGTEPLLGTNPPQQLADTMHAVAESLSIDLIILCSHGYTGWKRRVLGSVAEKVAHYAPIPVLLLREGGPALIGSSPTRGQVRALVPLDGSVCAKSAFVPAACLIAALSAPEPGALHLTRVVALPEEAQLSPGECDALLYKARQYLRSTAEQLREGLVAPPVADLELAITWSVTAAEDIASGILQAAEDGQVMEMSGMTERSDLIAMATHGYSGMQRWAMGSITARVLHGSRLPLLIVRPPNVGEKHLQRQEDEKGELFHKELLFT